MSHESRQELILLKVERGSIRFIVAVDGSTPGERALDYVIELATAMREEPSITAVHAVDPEIYAEGGTEPVADLVDAEQRLIIENIEDAEKRGRKVLDEAAESAANQGIELSSKLPYPTPSALCASVLEGRALMWTPGNQSPAIGR
ncbi:universal stress protein [Halorientalis salina]|uniref:universal stress protein n=1 Tax=Halorientalis salina TaxID=2932266 RepID=UPI002022A5DA|nr:universal stress protein [Halorientalis salina]